MHQGPKAFHHHQPYTWLPQHQFTLSNLLQTKQFSYSSTLPRHSVSPRKKSRLSERLVRPRSPFPEVHKPRSGSSSPCPSSFSESSGGSDGVFSRSNLLQWIDEPS